MSTETPIVPSSYSVTIDQEEGTFLSILLETQRDGLTPYAALTVGTPAVELSGRTVGMAVNELAYRLETLAGVLRQMAPRLPSLPEQK